MPKFYILDAQACKVTWRFPVEAADENEAWEKYANGEHGQAIGPPEIGDADDSIQFDLDIETVPDEVVFDANEPSPLLKDVIDYITKEQK